MTKPRQFDPANDERIIDEAYQDLLNGYLRSNHRKKVEVIERAFRFAKEAHKGVRRRSGEPYILHPIAVAKIASQEIGLGSTSICAALLHDVVEDTDYTVEDIERNFGPKVAQLVDGLTKISGGIFGDRASAQAENFRKLLLTMSEDIRVVLLKMADRLHNMRTLGSMAPNKQYKIAGETLYIYAPLAHRLGLFAIKTELEDLSFKYEHPAAYERISQQITQSEADRTAVYRDFARPVLEKLNQMGIKYEAKARLKSVYSIWKKMEKKHIPFEEVYDLYAARIVFDCDDPAQEKAICWAIYSAITDLYRLHPERTRDWISVPKANGYQALHLTVMGPDGNWVEVQIRSRRMDQIAEKGFAAHWKYKTGEECEEDSELNNWLRAVKDILDNPGPSAIDFLDTIKLNLFASEIGVFTPSGELINLPTDATVLDAAFALHTELGLHCIAGKVNHKLQPLSHKLRSGDQVEILTSQTQVPQAEWEDFLVTARARTRLRQGLRRMRQPMIAKGREMLDSWLSDNQLPDNNAVITKMQGVFNVSNREELYYRLGTDQVKLGDFLVTALRKAAQLDAKAANNGLFSKILRLGRKPKVKALTEGESALPVPTINTKETYLLGTDAAGQPNYRIEQCCTPMPGDDVMGYIGDDGRVTVHSLTCPKAQLLKATYGSRIVATQWQTRAERFPAQVEIEGIDRHGILQELIQLISTHMGIDIRKLNIEAKAEVFHCDLWVLVADASAVDQLVSQVRGINGVQRAARIH